MKTSKEGNKKQISGVILVMVLLGISLAGFFVYNFSVKDYSKDACLRVVPFAQANETVAKNEASAIDKKKAKAPKKDVTVYVTSWCRYCTITINFLKEHNIPFVVKDIEKNSDYREEMMAKAKMCRGGIPVVEIDKEIYCGYVPNVLKKLAQ